MKFGQDGTNKPCVAYRGTCLIQDKKCCLEKADCAVIYFTRRASGHPSAPTFHCLGKSVVHTQVNLLYFEVVDVYYEPVHVPLTKSHIVLEMVCPLELA